MGPKQRVICVRCGGVYAGRKPRGGDGTFLYPNHHRVNGAICDGAYSEGEWVSNPLPNPVEGGGSQ